MANSDIAFNFVIKHEDRSLKGTVTLEPKGGLARFGINSVAHPTAISDGFYKMPPDQALAYAQRIFREDYWTHISGDMIREQKVADRYADLAFNLGVAEATRLVQKALGNLCTAPRPFNYDGKLNPATVLIINNTDPIPLLEGIRGQAEAFYRKLAENDPTFQSSLNGWIERLNSPDTITEA